MSPLSTDVTKQIARLDDFESELGLSLEALFAELTSDTTRAGASLSVFGEVHARRGETIPSPILIVTAVYDVKGRVVASRALEISRQAIYLLDPFKFKAILLPVAAISRVLVYPIPG